MCKLALRCIKTQPRAQKIVKGRKTVMKSTPGVNFKNWFVPYAKISASIKLLKMLGAERETVYEIDPRLGYNHTGCENN